MIPNNTQHTANNHHDSACSPEPQPHHGRDFLILAEPRPIVVGRSWMRSPNGTPIWAGFAVGMRAEEICERFPLLTQSSEGEIAGPCKLFGYEATVSCGFDPDGELETLFIRIDADSGKSAAEKFNEIASHWEDELYPADEARFREGQASIRKGDLSLEMMLFDFDPEPHVLLCMSASDAQSHRAYSEAGLISESPRGDCTVQSGEAA